MPRTFKLVVTAGRLNLAIPGGIIFARTMMEIRAPREPAHPPPS